MNEELLIERLNAIDIKLNGIEEKLTKVESVKQWITVISIASIAIGSIVGLGGLILTIVAFFNK